MSKLEQFNKDFITIFETMNMTVGQVANGLQLDVPTIRRYLEGTTTPTPIMQKHVLNALRNLNRNFMTNDAKQKLSKEEALACTYYVDNFKDSITTSGFEMKAFVDGYTTCQAEMQIENAELKTNLDLEKDSYINLRKAWNVEVVENEHKQVKINTLEAELSAAEVENAQLKAWKDKMSGAMSLELVDRSRQILKEEYEAELTKRDIVIEKMKISNEERQQRINQIEKENEALKKLNDLSEIRKQVQEDKSLTELFKISQRECK